MPQSLIKELQLCSNNKEIYLGMMKSHLKRTWVQYMSNWIVEHGLEEHGDVSSLSPTSVEQCDSQFLQYPVLEVASSLHLRHLKVRTTYLLSHAFI